MDTVLSDCTVSGTVLMVMSSRVQIYLQESRNQIDSVSVCRKNILVYFFKDNQLFAGLQKSIAVHVRLTTLTFKPVVRYRTG